MRGSEKNDTDSIVDATEFCGYEEASPDVAKQAQPHPRRASLDCQVIPKRSSLRDPKSPRKIRRASIQIGVERTVFLPGQMNPSRRRNSITFNESVEIKSVENLKDRPENRNKLWFQKEEYIKMRRMSMELVKKIEQGCTGVGNRKYCVRGLEKWINKDTLFQARNQAWGVVLNVQHSQRWKGDYDEEAIAWRYRSISSTSVKEAAERAQRDLKAIGNYMAALSV